MSQEYQGDQAAGVSPADAGDFTNPRFRDIIAEKFPDESELIGENEEFDRMPTAQRIQHIFLMVCFFTLVLTGLPLILKDNSLVKAFYGIEGGFAFRRALHHIAGIGLVIVSVVQLLYITLSDRGNKDFRAILPVPKDAFDVIHTFMHNLGLSTYLKRKGYFPGLFEKYQWLSFEEPPRFAKYNFIEKFEYLALMWGNIIMILTGLMMWFIEFSLAFVPMWAMDVIRVVHGYEALLALLAIVIWHMYNVHLNPEVFPMSRIWLTGKISRKQLRHHHPLEYEEILLERRKQRDEKAAENNEKVDE